MGVIMPYTKLDVVVLADQIDYQSDPNDPCGTDWKAQ